MATVIDVSSRLGEYMLKGWVLTDRICSKCAKVPLMRSPSSALVESHFCVNCDPAPSAGNAANATKPAPTPAAPRPPTTQDSQSISSASTGSTLSRSSSPPTEVSQTFSSPPLLPVMDTTELLRRRRQSDTASAEIGKRMLKGWAMLADECPNPECYGVPLVRPPKSGGGVDAKKECVICGIIYVDEKDAYGQDRLVPIPSSPSPANTSRGTKPVASPVPTPSPSFDNKGKTRAHFDDNRLPSMPKFSGHRDQDDVIMSSDSTTSSALEISARSLEQTLVALSGRLTSCTNAPVMDPTPIGQTADAISKVAQALTQVKQLLWSEHQALL